jgi:DNA polymerase III epsilon subunit family exonuclease
MRKHNLAFVDIELTGLDLTRHEIIEIGCIVTEPNFKIIEEFELKIKPERIGEADPISMKINHYSANEWKDAHPLKKALEIFSEKVRDCIMVGHNVAFDSGFLECAFSGTGVKNTMHYHKLDTISIAWAKLHKRPDIEHFSLRDLCAQFDIKNENAHNALSDARATFLLYKKLIEL